MGKKIKRMGNAKGVCAFYRGRSRKISLRRYCLSRALKEASLVEEVWGMAV